MYTDRVEAGLSQYSPEVCNHVGEGGGWYMTYIIHTQQLQQLISSGKLKEDDTSLLPTEVWELSPNTLVYSNYLEL